MLKVRTKIWHKDWFGAKLAYLLYQVYGKYLGYTSNTGLFLRSS